METDQRLREETEKWLKKAEQRRKVINLRDPESKRDKDMLQNVDNYISDCKHFLEKGMFVEAFEASIWIHSWLEIMERLGIVTDMVIHDTNSIVIEKDGKVLLIKRNNEPEKGSWGPPGGHEDEGETHWESAQREAKEEAGDIEVEKDIIAVFPHEQGAEKRIDQVHIHVDHVFRGKAVGEIKAGDDAAECSWFSKDELKNVRLAGYSKLVLKKLGYLD